jgi:hypothetical protein
MELVEMYEKRIAPFGTESLRTSVFASERIERLMRRHTWQGQAKRGKRGKHQAGLAWEGTDESELVEAKALPIFTAPTNSIRGIGAYAARALTEGEFIGEYTG